MTDSMTDGAKQAPILGKTEPLTERSTQEMALHVLATLHVVPFLRWERENETTFETQRAKMLDTLTSLVGQLRSDGSGLLRHLLLGGQTVILEDVAALRPDVLTYLIVCNATNRVEAGPWYIQVDEALVSGESLIRNLLTAQADAERYGLKLSNVAFTPDYGGHVAQLPQILRGFGIDAIYLQHTFGSPHLPFRWEAPSGSSVLVFSHDTPQRQNVVLSVRDQKAIRPEGPYLWLASVDQLDKLKIPAMSIQVVQSSLQIFTTALRSEFADALRPALKGELRLPTPKEGRYLLTGTLSARLHLKQQNAQLENLLIHVAEPLLAIAQSHGKLESAENLRALLNHSWRTLMKNQARAVLGGCAVDAVQAEAETRYRQAHDSTQHLIERALNALPGKPHIAGYSAAPAPNTRMTYIVVWNPHNWVVRQSVELRLDIASDQHPVRVVSADGAETPFAWVPAAQRLMLIASVPAVGYTTFAIELGSTPIGESLIQRSTADSIADSRGRLLSVGTGSLIWRYRGGFDEDREEVEIRDVLRLIDSGDAGDVFTYSPPSEDVIEQAMLVSGLQTESSLVHERLILRHRMRIAPSLKPNRTRERGVRLLEFTTTATLYEDLPGLYFQTSFENTACDHRLRAHLRTGIRSQTVLADTAFGIIERPIHVEGSPFPASPRQEGVVSTYPMRGVCAVQDQNAAMALLSRGLPEFEALPDGDQTTLALTLVRAVGWISRDDLRTRTAAIGAVRPAPAAQCLRPIHADYALMPLVPHDPAMLLRASQMYNAPLQAFQYDAPPEKPRRSYLSIQTSLGIGSDSDGNGAILTALKPPQNGKGWVLRLLNPTDEEVEAQITPNLRPKYARYVSLAEDSQRLIEPDGNGTITAVLAPHQILTLRLGFN